MVRQNNFTLGEAPDFTQRFSKSVGVLGVNGIDFVNKLAYAGEEGRTYAQIWYGVRWQEMLLVIT